MKRIKINPQKPKTYFSVRMPVDPGDLSELQESRMMSSMLSGKASREQMVSFKIRDKV